MTPAGRAALAVVLVAAAGPAGFLLYHVVFHGSHALPVAPSSAVSAPASAPGSAPRSASFPSGPSQITQAPVLHSLPEGLALPDLGGTMHRLGEYRGRPLLLNFWATWCEPCQREIPLLEALHQERGSSLQIVGIAVDFKKDVAAYAHSHGIRYPLLLGEQDGLAAVQAFGMQPVFPFTVFADSSGDIVAVKVGELHADEARLILGKLSAVDAGTLTVANARNLLSTELRNLALVRAQQATRGVGAGGGKS